MTLKFSKSQSNILIYQNENGNIKVDVRFEDESVWLSQAQICEVFGKAKSTISEHIKAVFEESELSPFELFGITEQFKWRVAEKL